MSKPPQSTQKSTARKAEIVAQKHPIKIIESLEFERDADAEFSPLERRSLYLALAEDPWIGTVIGKNPALREVVFFNYVVVYAVSPNLDTLFLLTLNKVDSTVVHGPSHGDGDGDSGHWKKIKASVDYLVKGGIFGGGKKLVEWLIDLIS